MKKIVDEIEESDKVVVFMTGNKVRWKGFDTNEELFWWMQEYIFQNYDNAIFQDIFRQLKSKKSVEELTIDEQIKELESELIELRSLKKNLN